MRREKRWDPSSSASEADVKASSETFDSSPLRLIGETASPVNQ